MKIIVTGVIEIGPDEYDPGPSGPLTERAYDDWINTPLQCVDDVTFTLAVSDDD